MVVMELHLSSGAVAFLSMLDKCASAISDVKTHLRVRNMVSRDHTERELHEVVAIELRLCLQGP